MARRRRTPCRPPCWTARERPDTERRTGHAACQPARGDARRRAPARRAGGGDPPSPRRGGGAGTGGGEHHRAGRLRSLGPADGSRPPHAGLDPGLGSRLGALAGTDGLAAAAPAGSDATGPAGIARAPAPSPAARPLS
ncbi:hypothetical protein E2C05_27195 [Paracraurococcus ruber]|nr:hypothetical protein E2C05_27195 [Paracraurococcus ruber]